MATLRRVANKRIFGQTFFLSTGGILTPQGSLLASIPNALYENQPNWAGGQVICRSLCDIIPPDAVGAGLPVAGWDGLWDGSTFSASNRFITNDVEASIPPFKVRSNRYPNGWGDGSSPVRIDGWERLGATAIEYDKVYQFYRFRINGIPGIAGQDQSQLTTYENQPVGTKFGFTCSGGPKASLAPNQNMVFLEPGHPGGSLIDTTCRCVMKQQGPASGNRGTTNTINNGASFITVGPYHTWESIWEINVIGSPNGRYAQWIDGVQTEDLSDIVWRDAGHPDGFYTWSGDMTWGGSGGFVKTRDDYIHFNHVYFWGVPS